MLRNLTLLVMLAGIISVESVNAAVQPPANNAPTPGQVQSTLPVNPSPTLPKSSAPVIVPPPTTANVAPGGPVFQVSKFVIEGNTAFPDSALQSQIAAYTNRDLTLADLYKAADKLTRFYQAHGYGVARATVPEQKITNGSVKLEVVEGKIGKFNVTGNVRTRTAVILRRTDSIAPGKLYTDAGMNRAILLINDLPGLQAQAVLEPGTAFGTVDVDLKTVETPVDGFVSIDNYGRDSIGRWRLNAGTDINSLTGSGDRLSAYVTHSSGNYLNFGALTYSLPLVPAGATLTTSYNRSEYHVAGHDFAALQLR